MGLTILGIALLLLLIPVSKALGMYNPEVVKITIIVIMAYAGGLSIMVGIAHFLMTFSR